MTTKNIFIIGLTWIILLMTVKAGSSQTNVYHPFPDSNAIWNFGYSNCSTYSFLNYSIVMSGDTLIANQTYHKLFIPYLIIGQVCDSPSIGYKGAIRDDLINKKVFIVPPNDTVEQLLYDFNLMVGDTIKGYLETSISNPTTVLLIDSILIGNNYRKRIYTQYFPPNVFLSFDIIEGIGSSYGLVELSPSSPGVDNRPYYTRWCFSQNGLTLFPDTITNCQLVNAVNSINETLNPINVFPNPNNGEFIINYDSSDMQSYNIKIYNLFGEEVFSNSKNGLLSNFQVDLFSVSPGVYFLSIETQKGNFSQKILIYKK